MESRGGGEGEGKGMKTCKCSKCGFMCHIRYLLLVEMIIESDNQKLKLHSHTLVGKKVQYCTGKRKVCHRIHGAGRCLGKLSLLGNIQHLSMTYDTLV